MPGVYISYPFCNQKCSFCNFASGVSSAEMKAAYRSTLLAELRAHEWEWQPETLYFGGGTPSLMPLEQLAEIVAAVPGSKMAEATLECAPGSFEAESAKDWARLGINRVSLGVQSFVDSELRQTGRRHDAQIVQRDVEWLRAAGITNINIDLIAGLPGQRQDSWRESLDWISRLDPPHVSVYIFEVDEDSRLGKETLLGGVRYGAALLPSEDATAEFYEGAVERLQQFGIARYEISNFAKPGFESKHNLKYWKLEPYVGFGLDAHSFDGVTRWSNPDELPRYLAFEREDRTASNASEEHFFVGLRLREGIQPTAQEWRQFERPIARWADAGLLQRQGDRLRLSDRGLLMSNEILQDFLLND